MIASSVDRFATTLAALTVAAAAAAAPAQAPESPSTAQPQATGTPAEGAEVPKPASQPPESDKLSLAFTPYVWLTGFSGKAGALDVELNLDQTFVDILDESNRVFGLMGAVDIEYKRLVFQVNGSFTHAEFDGDRGVAHSGAAGGDETVNVSAELDVDAAWFEALGGYRFVDKPIGKSGQSRFMVDGFVGLRVTEMDLDLSVTADETVTLPNGITLEGGNSYDLSQSEGWFEPFFGANLKFWFGEHWLLLVRGDVGAFGIDNSDFSWQALGALGYQWNLDGWSISAFGGYRALSQDFSDGGFTWDATTHGVIFGASFKFIF